jgi:hypothetical protein
MCITTVLYSIYTHVGLCIIYVHMPVLVIIMEPDVPMPMRAHPTYGYGELRPSRLGPPGAIVTINLTRNLYR